MRNIKTLYILLAVVSISMSGSDKSPEKSIGNKYFAAGSIASASDLHKLNRFPNDLPLHEIPILCYHQIREWKKTDSKKARTYIISPGRFQKQIKMLLDSGYHFILPAQFVSYNATRGKIPQKPIMLTFDDATITQFSEALPVLNKHGIKAVFFIMTVVLNHPKYMSSKQVKTLAEQGHTIGCHTWDHHNVTNYKEADWKIQVENATQQLELITGKTIEYFAYPNGIWNVQAVDQLKKNGFLGAFQLAGKQDKMNPHFTIRRIIADGNWNERQLLNAVKHSFK